MNKKIESLATQIIIEIKKSKKPTEVAGTVVFDIVNEISNSTPEAIGILNMESMRFYEFLQRKVSKQFIKESVKKRNKRF